MDAMTRDTTSNPLELDGIEFVAKIDVGTGLYALAFRADGNAVADGRRS